MKKIKYILAAIGFVLPLFGLIDNDLLIIAFATNPLALFFSYFVGQLFNLSDTVYYLALAVIGGLIYFILGIVIENLFPAKKTEFKKGTSHKKSSMIFLIFLIIMSLFAVLFFYMIRGALSF